MVRTVAIVFGAAALLAITVLWLTGDRLSTDTPRESPAAARPSSGAPTVEVTTPPSAIPRAPAPASLRTEPNILTAITRASLPDVEVPPWADAMEGTILSYIAQHPGLELTDLQVQCATSECVIFMGGERIPVYQMGFDVFADENGFESAVIRSMDGGPNRFVYLRR